MRKIQMAMVVVVTFSVFGSLGLARAEPGEKPPFAYHLSRGTPTPGVVTAIQALRDACTAWPKHPVTNDAPNDVAPSSFGDENMLCDAATHLEEMQWEMGMTGGFVAVLVLIAAAIVFGVMSGLFWLVRGLIYKPNPRAWS